MLGRLDAGEPVTVPAWMLGGNSFPTGHAISFIAERTCAAVEVSPTTWCGPPENRLLGIPDPLAGRACYPGVGTLAVPTGVLFFLIQEPRHH